MKKILLGALVLLSFSSCRFSSEEINLFTQGSNSIQVWTNKSNQLELKSSTDRQPINLNQPLKMTFEKNGNWLWSKNPSVTFTDIENKSINVNLTDDFIKGNTNILSPKESNLPYFIKIQKLQHPIRSYTELRTETTPQYMMTTSTDINGNITTSSTLIGYDTEYFTDYYMDGSIEIRIGFYEKLNERPSGIFYSKKDVKHFLIKSERYR